MDQGTLVCLCGGLLFILSGVYDWNFLLEALMSNRRRFPVQWTPLKRMFARVLAVALGFFMFAVGVYRSVLLLQGRPLP